MNVGLKVFSVPIFTLRVLSTRLDVDCRAETDVQRSATFGMNDHRTREFNAVCGTSWVR